MSKDWRPVEMYLTNEFDMKPKGMDFGKQVWVLKDSRGNMLESEKAIQNRKQLQKSFNTVFLFVQSIGENLIERAKTNDRAYLILDTLNSVFDEVSREAKEMCLFEKEIDLSKIPYCEDTVGLSLRDVVKTYFYGKFDDHFYYNERNRDVLEEYLTTYIKNNENIRGGKMTKSEIEQVLYSAYKTDWKKGHLTQEIIEETDAAWTNYCKEEDPVSFEEYLDEFGYTNGEMYVCLDEFIDNEMKNSAYMAALIEEYLPNSKMLDTYYKLPLSEPLKDDATETGGVSHIGETLLNFMAEAGLPLDIKIKDLNKNLKACGIAEVKRIKSPEHNFDF